MDQITISMTQYMKDHPRMKYIFFGGKGGVGKTVMAGTAALWAAKQGKKTLLASTNPVHSLSSLLEQDVFGKAAVVCDEKNCYAFEIDTKDTIERSKNEIRKKMNWFLKFADITTKADDFIESATMNPAFEESAMFENMVDLMFKDEYDFYVFDTAPTGKSLRELAMPFDWAGFLQKQIKEGKELARLMNMGGDSFEALERDKRRYETALEVLRNPATTVFTLVLLPERELEEPEQALPVEHKLPEEA